MRAFVLTEFGATPEVAEVEIPEPAEGEVRVRVHAAAVNGFDVAVASSYLKDMMEHRFPVVLGKDFAGTVDAVGAGVTGYEVGDRVFGVVTKPHLGDGSFAEYVTVSTAVGLAKLPEEIDFVTGAALGLAGAAAISAVDAAELEPGQTVLVVGATGGVGNQAVQLAAKAGAHVVATAASDEERALVRDLGAAETVDYSGDVVEAVREAHPDGVDAVLHFAGGAADYLPVLRKGGRLASTLIMSPDQVPTEDATVIPIYANPEPAVLDRAAGHHVEGVQPHAGTAHLRPRGGAGGAGHLHPGHPRQGRHHPRLSQHALIRHHCRWWGRDAPTGSPGPATDSPTPAHDVRRYVGHGTLSVLDRARRPPCRDRRLIGLPGDAPSCPDVYRELLSIALSTSPSRPRRSYWRPSSGSPPP